MRLDVTFDPELGMIVTLRDQDGEIIATAASRCRLREDGAWVNVDAMTL